jgi:excisionase family DNA binding protein
MATELITKDDLNQFKQELLNDLKQILQPQLKTDVKWLKSYQVRELLGLSRGTLQQMRDNGTLTATKVGSLWFYSSEDITSLMNRKNKKN